MDPHTPDSFSQLTGDNNTRTHTMHYPDPNKKYIVYTDASEDACGEHSSHRNTMDQMEFPIAFLSHTFTETERKWSTTKQEAYGVYYTTTKWNYNLQGALTSL